MTADTLIVHRLLQTVVRAALGEEDQQACAAAAVRLLKAAFPFESGQVENWPESERLLPHALAVADHGRRLDVESAVWPWLLHQAAMYLRSRGQFRQARTPQEEAVAGRLRVLGDDHPDTLQSMHSLAVIRRNLGDLQGACQLFVETLAARRRVLGDDHPDTLWSMNSLAVTRRNLGDLQGARELHKQTLAACRRVLGDEHPDTQHSMNSLAPVRRELGEL